MKIFLLLILFIGGITALLFYGIGPGKELKQVVAIQSNKSNKKNLAQLNIENPKGNEEPFPQPPSEGISNPEKEPSLEPETQVDEEDKIKREEEFTKYCETAPDDPQCD